MINCKVKIRGSGLINCYNSITFSRCVCFMGRCFWCFWAWDFWKRHQLDFSSQASSTFQGQTETMVKIMLKIVEWWKETCFRILNHSCVIVKLFVVMFRIYWMVKKAWAQHAFRFLPFLPVLWTPGPPCFCDASGWAFLRCCMLADSDSFMGYNLPSGYLT